MELAGYTEIKTGSGRPLFVRTEIHPLFMRVYKEYRTDYHMTSIMRVLMTLNTEATRGENLNLGGGERSIKCGYIRMNYRVFNGSVLINQWVISKADNAGHVQLVTVQYRKDCKEWEASRNEITSLNKNSLWKSEGGTAHYAAVAGKFDSAQSAASHMSEHIIGSYQKAHYLTRHDKGSQYSLFWIVKGSHKSQEAAESLASIMQQNAWNRLPVNWLIHGDAVHTLKNCAKLINTPLAKCVKGHPLQKVLFLNPACSDNEKSLSSLCEKLNIEFVGLYRNKSDFALWITWKKWVGQFIYTVIKYLILGYIFYLFFLKP